MSPVFCRMTVALHFLFGKKPAEGKILRKLPFYSMQN